MAVVMIHAHSGTGKGSIQDCHAIQSIDGFRNIHMCFTAGISCDRFLPPPRSSNVKG